MGNIKEPKYDNDLINLGYLKKTINNSEKEMESKNDSIYSKSYTSPPIPPYYAGATYYSDNKIYRCVKDRLVGSFSISDWIIIYDEKKENIMSQNFLFLSEVELKEQQDGKIETFNQDNDPSVDWETSLEKSEHEGDYWRKNENGFYNIYTYVKYATNPITFSWELVDVPIFIFNTITGHKTIYTMKPSSYVKYDLWKLTKDDIELFPECEIGDYVEAINSSDVFSVSDWIKKDDEISLKSIETYYYTTSEIDKFVEIIDENMKSEIQKSDNSIRAYVSESYTTKETTIDLTKKVDANGKEIEKIYGENTTTIPTLNLAQLSIQADGINSSVIKKVGIDEVISRINQSAEAVKIDAHRVDIDAIATFTNSKLAESGSTVINGSNITTGKIKTNVIEGYDSLILSVKNNTDAIGDRTGKSTTITQDINSIEAQISDIADITTSANTSNGTIPSSELKNVASSFPIRIEIKPINTNISYLYPNSKLFPSARTFLKTRKLRFTNESTNEIFDYILPENLLYYDETTYDEFIADYESNICQVIKRCKYNADGTVSPLSEPIIKDYSFADEIENNFSLTEGNYSVKLLGYQEGYIFVRLMVLNAYTAQYATKVELSSSVKQTAEDITSQVALTYETKDNVEKQYSEIKQTTNSISQTVANNNTKANIVTQINDTSSQIKIEADNININGMISAINNNTSTTINGNKITTGSITADKIKANSITSNQVASDIITTTNFSAQQINANNITSGTISTSRLSSDVITTTNFSAQEINADKITSGSLSADRINGGTINANNINVTNINGTNVNRGTISGASINIYNGTGFFKMLSGSAYHPYVSALNVAAYANSPSASGPGLSFRSSNNRDTTGNQIGYISYGSNGNAIYHSNGAMNIDSGGNLAIASGGYIALRTGGSSSDAIYVWNKIDLNASGSSSVWAKGNNLASGKVKTDNGSASSRIVKENIEEFKNEYDEAYELLKQIKLYSYDYKYNLYKNKHQFGFIIDDIEKLDNYNKFFDFQSSVAKVEGNEIDFSSYDGYTEENKPDDCIVVKKYDSDVLDKYLLTLCKAMQNKIDKLEEKINEYVN